MSALDYFCMFFIGFAVVILVYAFTQPLETILFTFSVVNYFMTGAN